LEEKDPVKRKKLGEVLQERGHISASGLAQAIADQQGKVIRLGELMLERELVLKSDLASALEEVTRIPYVDCTTLSPTPEVLALIPRHLALRCCVFPVEKEGTKLVVVMAEPQNVALYDEVCFNAGINLSPRIGFRNDILAAIEKHYVSDGSTGVVDPSDPASGPQMEFVSTSSRQANRDAIEEAQAELARRHSPAVRLVSEVITLASEKKASDIHIEPQLADVIVRIRVDGVLRDLIRVPSHLHHSFVSRIKILADMDIADRRSPQDGRFLVRMGGKQLDMRVSTLPTQYGEKVVIRLLDSADAIRSFAGLGLPADVERALCEVLSQPQGMVLVTGPTGSGKSTSLYASLNFLRKPSINIVSVEDPVEYVLAGINQVHVNNKAGLTFASCLRSILRQDPNVIMVGEIRDRETAEISMKAAQTGHMLLSTLHTNDSVSAITRLVDLGIPPFMIAASMTGIIAQRLVRKLCTCNDLVKTPPEIADRLVALGHMEPVSHVHIPVGCEDCDQTGYRGRVGIYEFLVFDDEVRESIRSGVSNEEIRAHMRSTGMRLMHEDGVNKILTGKTSIEEIARVVPIHGDSFAECSECGRKSSPTFRFCPHCGTEREVTASRRGVRASRADLERTLKQ